MIKIPVRNGRAAPEEDDAATEEQQQDDREHAILQYF
jgi:hypothetical protein